MTAPDGDAASSDPAGTAGSATDERILRLAVVGSFGGVGDGSGRRLEVDRNSLEQAMAALEPSVDLGALSAEGVGALEGQLHFASWADWQPVGFGQRVDATRRLIELRGLLERHAQGELDAQAVRAAADPALPSGLLDELLGSGDEKGRGAASAGATVSAPAARPGESSVDSILDLVAAPPPEESREAAARRAVGALTSARRGKRRRKAAPRQSRLDPVLAVALDAILRQPDVAALERTWRGLRFLLAHADPRKGVRVELVDCGLEGAADAVRALASGPEVDLVLVVHELDASARDLARFEALGEAGAAIQAPVVVGIAPAFFELDDWSSVTQGRSPRALFDEGAAYAGWRSLRAREAARWVVPVVNRLALRAAYGPEGERARELPFAQPPEAGLFGTAVWAVGAVAARAFAQSGACVRLSGTRHGLVSDLPLVTRGGRALPLEGAPGEERREDFERAGFAALAHYQRDIAFLGALRSFRQPERYPDAEATADAAQQVTLAYQLFASRFVRFLGRVLGEIRGSGSSEEATQRLRAAVCRFVSNEAHPLPADHVGIEMTPNAADGALTDIALRIQPELSIAGRPLNVMLSFSVAL